MLSNIVPGSFQQSNLDIINATFASFCEKYPARPFTPKKQTRLKLPQSRKRRRKALFKILQRLWYRNRARCAKMVATGDYKKMDIEAKVMGNAGAAIDILASVYGETLPT